MCWDYIYGLSCFCDTERMSPAVINSCNLCFHSSEWQHQFGERTYYSHIIGKMHIHSSPAATTKYNLRLSLSSSLTVCLCVSQGTSSAIWEFTMERSRIPAPSVTRVSPRNQNSVGTCFPTPAEVSSAATAENRWGTRTAWSHTRDCTLERDPIAALSVEKVRTWYKNLKVKFKTGQGQFLLSHLDK